MTDYATPEPQRKAPEDAVSCDRPLDGDVRSTMEARFGSDFGQVRIHSDEQAAARGHDAIAFTTATGRAVQRAITAWAGEFDMSADLAAELTGLNYLELFLRLDDTAIDQVYRDLAAFRRLVFDEQAATLPRLARGRGPVRARP